MVTPTVYLRIKKPQNRAIRPVVGKIGVCNIIVGGFDGTRCLNQGLLYEVAVNPDALAPGKKLLRNRVTHNTATGSNFPSVRGSSPK